MHLNNNYIMDHADLTVSNFKENSLAKTVNFSKTSVR